LRRKFWFNDPVTSAQAINADPLNIFAKSNSEHAWAEAWDEKKSQAARLD